MHELAVCLPTLRGTLPVWSIRRTECLCSPCAETGLCLHPSIRSRWTARPIPRLYLRAQWTALLGISCRDRAALLRRLACFVPGPTHPRRLGVAAADPAATAAGS